MLAINLIQAILCYARLWGHWADLAGAHFITGNILASADLTVALRRIHYRVILICKCEFFSIPHSDLIEVINSSCGESLAIKCFQLKARLIES